MNLSSWPWLSKNATVGCICSMMALSCCLFPAIIVPCGPIYQRLPNHATLIPWAITSPWYLIETAIAVIVAARSLALKPIVWVCAISSLSRLILGWSFFWEEGVPLLSICHREPVIVVLPLSDGGYLSPLKDSDPEAVSGQDSLLLLLLW